MSDRRLASFRQVLLAALETAYYRPRLEAASLATLAAVSALRSVEEGLWRLPWLEARALLEHPERFRNPGAPAGQEFRERVKFVPNGWRCRLGFEVQTVSGTLAELRRFADEVTTHRTTLPRGTRRLVVSTRAGVGLLTEAERDALWQAFELPVFEEIRDFDGGLLVWECEAHDGFHVREETAVVETLEDGAPLPEIAVTSLFARRYPILRLRTGIRALVVRGACGCGEPALRLVRVTAAAGLQRAAAAIAG